MHLDSIYGKAQLNRGACGNDSGILQSFRTASARKWHIARYTELVILEGLQGRSG